MFYSNTVRSVVALLAVSGMVSACGPAASNAPRKTPAKNADGSQTISETAVRQAIDSMTVTDAAGTVVSEATGVAALLKGATNVTITRGGVRAANGDVTPTLVVDFGAVKFTGANEARLVSATEGVTAEAKAEAAANGLLETMEIVVTEGEAAYTVVVVFGAQDQTDVCEPTQDQGKDDGKQDQGQQDQGKDDGKQDQGKQDQGKQDQGKQDQGKQDQGKQDQGKQDQGKQDQGKQDQGKQDQGKQDQGKKA